MSDSSIEQSSLEPSTTKKYKKIKKRIKLTEQKKYETQIERDKWLVDYIYGKRNSENGY